MSKSMRLQICLDPKMYLEILQEAKTYGITANNDSDLVRKILIAFFEKIPMQTIEIEQLKTSCANKNAVIEMLRKENAEIKGVKVVPVKS